MSIKISAIIPVYNCEKYLSKTLDSCLSQDINDFEIICVNDGSTDSSPDILREYEKKDSRIIVIDQENSGAGIARNRALDAARGEFVAFIDADDWYPDDKVWSMLYSSALSNNVKAAGGIVKRYFYDDVTDLYPEKILKIFSKNTVVDYSEYQFDYGYQAYIFDRLMLTENNIGLAELKRFQDPPFLVRALFQAKKIYVTDKVTYCYRRENAPSTISSEKIIDAMKGISMNLDFAKMNGLNDLYAETVSHINEFGYAIYYKIIEGDDNVYCSLIELAGKINNDLIDKNETRIDRILLPFKLLSSTALRYETLRSKKLTRIMSAVPRRITEKRLEKEGK